MGRLGFCAITAFGLTLCAPAFAQVCGNGVREGAEQCDDGNRASFDGCSARCAFEQVHRANQLKLQFGSDVACPANALGGAFATAAQPTIQEAIGASVKDGSTSFLMYFVGLGDLSGQADPELQLGLFSAVPLGTGPTYDGNNDVDWWYLIDDAQLVAPQTPANLLDANITSTILAAGPGSFTLNTVLGGGTVALSMTALKLVAPTSAVTTPLAWTDGTARGHLPDENLDPALQSFSLTGNDGGTTSATLCGNTSAGSLAATFVPASLLSSCVNYTAAHTLLDLIVGGCTYLGIIPVIAATQPDQGGGDVYKFFENSSHFITSCTKNNVAEPLENCLASAAYSTYFRFSTDRVIALSSSSSDFVFYDNFE